MSSDSKASNSTSRRRAIKKTQATESAQQSSSTEQARSKQERTRPRGKPENRKSMMSFASDSTKIGEIPERKWANPAMFDTGNSAFPITPYYPLGPYQEPEKQRSRFMRLFRR